MGYPVKGKQEKVVYKKIEIKWKCGDCFNKGKLKVELPIQLRELHMRLEESHRKVRGHIMCPSNYFEVIDFIK